MTWEEAVKTMGEWFEQNVHSYWEGGGKHGELSKDNPRFIRQLGSRRCAFKCELLENCGGEVQNDCTAFVGSCCMLFKPEVFGKGFFPGSAMFADKNGSSAQKMQAAGFQVLDWPGQSGLQPGDVICGHYNFGADCHHGEIYAGDGKAYAWGSVKDGKNGRPGEPCPWANRKYNVVFRLPGGWTGTGSAIATGGGGGGGGGGAVGGGGGAGGLVTQWDGDWDQEAASADASRGKKLFSTTTAQANILSLLFTGKDSSTLLDSSIMKTPPRIWQYFPPEIVMPTISFPVNPFEEDEPIWDASTQKLVAKKLKDKLEKQEKNNKNKNKKTETDPKKIAENENERIEELKENKKKKSSKSKNKGKKSSTDVPSIPKGDSQSESGSVKSEDDKWYEKNIGGKWGKITQDVMDSLPDKLKDEWKRGTGEQAKKTHEKWWENDNKKKEVLDPAYANQADLKKDLGRSYPIIYINDHMYSEDEIEYFKLDCMDFLPVIELHVTSSSKSTIKQELPKEGDTVGVFIQYTHTMIAPLRCDFQITQCITKAVSQEFMDQNVSMIIYGELKIPDLYNSDIAFEYKGSARNALIDIAQKLKLGFCFNDPEDSSDAQCWYCTPEQSGDPKQYMEDLTTHIYKDASSFYTSWIDPRYNLTVINVRDMLGRTADCDDGIDLTKMVSVINNNYFEGNRQEVNKSIITPKLFNNFLGEQQSDTYYVYDYHLVNRASEISNKMGLIRQSNFGINACGLSASLTVTIKPELCLNWEKIEGVTAKGKPVDPPARYIAFTGPGINKNQNDNPPENGTPYSQSRVRVQGATDWNVQSDEEMEDAKNAPTNNITIMSQNEANRLAAGVNADGETVVNLEEVTVVGQAGNKNVPGQELKGLITTLDNKLSKVNVGNGVNIDNGTVSDGTISSNNPTFEMSEWSDTGLAGEEEIPWEEANPDWWKDNPDELELLRRAGNA